MRKNKWACFQSVPSFPITSGRFVDLKEPVASVRPTVFACSPVQQDGSFEQLLLILISSDSLKKGH